jgi:two-component system invasion response regulator UvrY
MDAMKTSGHKTTVLVVDDHELVRTGTSRLLEDIHTLEVIGQGASGEEAVEQVRTLRPDVVLMDVQMPGIGGLEATRQCLMIDPGVRVIIVTVFEEQPLPSRALKMGARGYLTKKADVAEMALAIETVMQNKRYITRDIALRLDHVDSQHTSPFESLSRREMQIALLVINGQRATSISSTLGLTTKTINNIRYRVFDKLGIRNDVDLVNLANRHGLLDE